MGSENAVVVYVGPPPRVELVWSFLRGHGVEAILLNHHSFGMELMEPPEIRVPAHQLELARDVLREFGLSLPGTPA